jgi:hypothetical protein
MKIPHRVFEERGPELVARVFLDTFYSTELQQSLASGLVGTHAGAKVLLCLFINVEPNLFVKATFKHVAPAKRSNTLP